MNYAYNPVVVGDRLPHGKPATFYSLVIHVSHAVVIVDVLLLLSLLLLFFMYCAETEILDYRAALFNSMALCSVLQWKIGITKQHFPFSSPFPMHDVINEMQQIQSAILDQEDNWLPSLHQTMER